MQFRETVDAAWLFTSATLVGRRRFSALHGCRWGSMTLKRCSWTRHSIIASKALMWLPDQLPEPRDPEFVPRHCWSYRHVPLLEASRGRAFSAVYLTPLTQAGGRTAYPTASRFPLFVQGEQPRSMLLEQFRELRRRRVLLGSSSFWEGVDVIGEALSLVVIDKLALRRSRTIR